jgi:hypothetical protein
MTCAGAVAARAQCEAASLLADDGEDFDWLGWHVDLDGDLAIVGADGEDEQGAAAGAAYVFRHDAGAWSQDGKLTALDGDTDDRFGCAVAIDGDLALAGAWGDDDLGEDCGAAYVFEHDGQAWQQRAKLVPPDLGEDDWFGFAIELQGELAVISSPLDDDRRLNAGAAYVYAYDGASQAWTLLDKLLPDSPNDALNFGTSLDLDRNQLAVGAFREVAMGMQPGAVYVFRDDGAGFAQEAYLMAPDPEQFALFGSSVAIQDDTLLVGAEWKDSDAVDAGEVYVFRNDGGGWSASGVMHPETPFTNGASYGCSVAIEGDLAVVGAYADLPAGSGAAYAFTWDGVAWNESARIAPSAIGASDEFAHQVALDGRRLLAGAPYADALGTNAGQAWIFNVHTCACAPDFNNDGELNSQDFIAFLNAFTAGSPSADYNADGGVNSQDFIAFLNDFVGGC